MNFLKKLFNVKQQLQFIQDDNGLHQLGGDIPSNFVIPDNEFLGGFQYLGYINNLMSTLLRRKVIILGIEERFHRFDRILDDYHRFLGHLFKCFAIFCDSIGQLYSFQVGPNEFIGIEFGGIRRDARDPQPFPCFGTQKGTGFIRFMPARIVPNQ